MSLTQPYSYDNGYISLHMPVTPGLPPTIEVKGYKLLLKSEFHISLIKARFVAELVNPNRQDQIEQEIVAAFEKFIATQPLTEFHPTGVFRLAQVDVRKTVVGMCEVPHLQDFFDQLRATYKVDIPDQPTHITMYTLQPEKGIGLLSPAQLEQDSQVVEIPEINIFKKAEDVDRAVLAV